MKKKATYKDAGVDIDAGNLAVEKIKKYVDSTFTKDVLLGVGLFAGAISAEKLMKFREPVLISSVDGVGTKLKVASVMNKWDTVGIDIVNHCANDILCQGAEPFYFLDYIASSKISPEQIEQIVKAMSTACKKLGIPLLGGETAEMPGVYEENETDIVGAITGIAEKSKMISGKNINENDVLIGIASDGLHTNGYSLARKIFFEMENKNVNDFIAELDSTVGEALLVPHREYVNTVISLMNEFEIKGIAHITGGGLIENPKRVLPDGLGIEIEKNSWNVPAIFKYMQKKGNVPEDDMYRIFNMGIGLVLFVSKNDADEIMKTLQKFNETAFLIGKVVKGTLVNLK